jgi:hypothetical protein
LKLKKRFVTTMSMKIQRWWRRYLKKAQVDAATTSLRGICDDLSKSTRKQMTEKKYIHKRKQKKTQRKHKEEERC